MSKLIKKDNKIIKAMALSLVLIMFSYQIIAAVSPSAINSKTETVTIGKEKRQVNCVYIDLKNNSIVIREVPAKGIVGQTDELKNIANYAVKDSKLNVTSVAAINGTFFSAYSDMAPHGTMQSDGRFMHLGNKGSVFGLTENNDSMVKSLFIKINGSINGKENMWMAWGLNHHYNDPKEIVIYTPEFGATTGKHEKQSVVVTNGVVTCITTGEVNIPKDGFAIMIGESYLNKVFKVGDKVSYKMDYYNLVFTDAGRPGELADWKESKFAVGAGPKLLVNGKIDVNAVAEGFTEAKIVNNRAQRSFIGMTKNKVLVIGTVSNVSINELAQIAEKLSLINAINLDGGASSSLYYNGKYLTKPGRNLSNAVVIMEKK